jgi:putative flippase GtrA
MAVLDRLTRGRGELAIRYSMVSVFGVVFTQLELAIYVGLLDLNPTKSNVAAVMICAVPSFMLNKRWVWNVDGKISVSREIVPFWVFTGAGLALSTLLVAIADNTSDSTLLVMIASVSGFGILWVAKFLFLDQVMFGHSEKEEVLSQEDHPAA